MSVEQNLQFNQFENETRHSRRFPRLSRFWLIYLVVFIVTIGIGIAVVGLDASDTSGVLIRDRNEWQHVEDLPVHPQQITVADSIWIVDENNDLIRFENWSNGVWSWYQVQDGDTPRDLAKTFHASRRDIERTIDDHSNNGELPIGEWIWIQGYQTYTFSDVGISNSATIRHFFAHGNQLLVIAEDSERDILVLFDGQSWQRPDTLEISGNIQAFSATTTTENSPFAIIVDNENTLHQIEYIDTPISTALTTIRQELNLPPIPANISTSLTLTADRHIFVLNDHLMRYDSNMWSTVPLPETLSADSLSILGTANNNIWLVDSGSVIWQLTPNTGEWQSFSPEITGIVSNTTVYNVTDGGEQVLFATEDGILAFDGERWWIDHRPTLNASVKQITLGNYNQVWALTDGEESKISTLYTALVGVFIVAILIMLGMTVRAAPRLIGVNESKKRREIIQQGLGEQLPKANEQKSQWEIGWRAVLVSTSPLLIIAAIGIILAIIWGGNAVENFEKLFESINDAFENVFPNAPSWVERIFTQLLFAAVIFILGLPLAIWAIMRTKDPEKRARLRLNIIGAFGGLLLISILETLASTLAEELEGKFFAIIVSFVVLVFVALSIVIILMMLYQKYLGSPKSALSQGNYDAVLESFNKPISAATTPLLWSNGAMLVEAGHFETAEELLRESIRKSDQSAIFSTFAFHPLQHLGAALNGLGRYTEAKDALDAALNIKKNSGYAHLRLAETYLLQNQSPELALEHLDKAHKNRTGIFSPFKRVKYVEAEIWANRAWAYSLLRQSYEVDNALEKAFTKASADIVPHYAGILWRAGKAMQLQRNRSKARDYFRQSLSTDPNGPFANRTRESLNELENEFI